MAMRFTSPGQGKLFRAIRSQLQRLGYLNDLLAEEYAFSDWFVRDFPERKAALAAFGQNPPSYETACFGVFLAEQQIGVELVQEYRAFGTPYAFEIGADSIGYWVVGRNAKATQRLDEFTLGDIDATFKRYADEWRPDAVLRAKNIKSTPQQRQRGLFDYDLVPKLEHRIRETLDPMVQDACSIATREYEKNSGRPPDPTQLFRLAFWMLAGKVLFDRRVDGFKSLTRHSSADEIIERVGSHYGEPVPRLLNKVARDAVCAKLWSGFDFRNLSIDVLTHIWTNTFVDAGIRKKLGIHPTPRSVAKFIVDSLPIDKIPEDDRTVLEPCCGSGTFLIAALQRLRDEMKGKHSPQSRHSYLQQRLIGFEKEPFGVEIARLCLTLADFPNPNGWQLRQQDVFDSVDLTTDLAKSRIVLCNPPFEDFLPSVRTAYGFEWAKKPVALLDIVLKHMHAEGIIGFVLPRAILDGAGYRKIRASLASRFGNIDVVSLPDKAFDTSEHETALLMAHNPKGAASGSTIMLRYSDVSASDWPEFKDVYKTTWSDAALLDSDEATKSLSVKQLARVWSGAKRSRSLGEIASFRRGLEWTLPLIKRGLETGNREVLVRDNPGPFCRLGVAPQATFYSFVPPAPKYLRNAPEDERGHSYDKPWDAPKVILKKAPVARPLAYRSICRRQRACVLPNFRRSVAKRPFVDYGDCRNHKRSARECIRCNPSK